MTQVGFSTHPGNIVSAVIRWVTKSKVSHAWILLDDDYFGTKMVMEAVGSGGFRLITYKTFLAEGNVIVATVTPRVPIDDGVKAAADWLGDSYDRPGFFGNAFVILGRWLKKKWRNPFQNAKALTCSEAVVRVLQAVNYPDSADLDPEGTNPEDLLLFLLANNPQVG